MYAVTCPSCSRVFDAVTAADCRSGHPAHTYECPHCGSCFCHAPQSYLEKFWDEAPDELRAGRKPEKDNEGADGKPASPPVVLFADDDPVGRAVARQVVTGLGFSIHLAENGQKALQMVRELKPDLLITDALMPGLDGREVARLTKEISPGSKVVVITSVYKDPRYKYEAYKQFDVDEYLIKPISPEKLREVVQKYLTREPA